jgi:mRNA-degrading endonuclease RelE of RelBE toxin-antitoxin system
MSYKILPTRQFSKDFEKLGDRKLKDTIKNKIEEVSKDPARYKNSIMTLKEAFALELVTFV